MITSGNACRERELGGKGTGMGGKNKYSRTSSESCLPYEYITYWKNGFYQSHRHRDRLMGCHRSGVGKMGEGSQKVQTAICKINKSWGRSNNFKKK